MATALVAACTGSSDGEPNAGSRAEPWPERPVVELTFDVAEDLATLEGRETVVFTPTDQVCELVFRLWPNKPTMFEDGTSMVLTDTAVDGVPVTPEIIPAGAPEGAPGTLAELPLPGGCVAAGTEIRAELGFAVELGEDSGERIGYDPDAELAWFATAFPMLAWVRDEGWARDHAVEMPGETATSEDFHLTTLAVTVPEQYRVLGTGIPVGSAAGPEPGTVTHRFTAEAVRNVSVSVGRFQVVKREVDGVTLHVGTPAVGSRVPPEIWADELEDKLIELEDLLGPYPYEHLWASIVPPLADGVEFPTSLQFGDVRRATVPALVAHELAHMWFYALVGNNQAENPWIDESFATYAQARAAEQEEFYTLDDIPPRVAGYLGYPMEYWAERGGFGLYVQGVYNQGAAVLLEARERVGAERFDAAMLSYIEANAHQVAGPAEVEAAFREVPEVLELLREYGALIEPA